MCIRDRYEVTKIHRLAPEVDGVKTYIDGFEIKILGMTVYRETNELTNSSLPKYISNFPYFTGFPAYALAKRYVFSLISVSYTHLDVYKRQEYIREQEE